MAGGFGRAFDLPYSREAGAASRRRIRGAGGQLRLLARSGRAAGQAHPDTRRPARCAAHGAQGTHTRGGGGYSSNASDVSEAGRAHRGQTGGANSKLPDAALAAAGALLRGERGALCAGCAELYALHFADPPLSGSDCASDCEGAAERGRAWRQKGRLL